jgi:hypothetical protein
MSLTNEQIKQIIDGAPDGATHYDTHRHGFKYWAIKMDFATHKLSDLAEILALRERVAGLEQGGWISVDERLPEYGVPVLVFVPEIDSEESYITTDLMDKDYEYWLLVSDNYNHAQAVGRATDNDIIPTGIAPYTHGQPLPQPPKENTNERD